MRVLVDVSIVPLGVGTSLSRWIALCQEVFRQHRLDVRLHPFGTSIEGEWEPVFAAIRACHERLHAEGAPRIATTIKVGTRTDKDQHLADKVSSVERQLHGGDPVLDDGV